MNKLGIEDFAMIKPANESFKRYFFVTFLRHVKELDTPSTNKKEEKHPNLLPKSFLSFQK